MAGESISQGWGIVSRGFRKAYDYFGTVMIISTIWFFLGLFPTWLSFLVFVQVPAINSLGIFLVCAFFLLGPLTAAVYSITDVLFRGDEVHYKEYFTHLKKHYKRSVRVTAAMGILLAILVVDLLYFLQLQFGFLQLVSVLWMYLILFWLMMMQYVYPLLVRREVGTWEILKMGALLAMDNIVATLIVGLFSVIVVVASYYLRVPLMLLMVGVIAFLHNAALDELLRKYPRAQALDEPVQNE